MAKINYLKCKDGVPVQPLAWTLDDTTMPPESGISWIPFDTEIIRPVDVGNVLVDGRVALDVSRKSAYDAAEILSGNRRDAIAAAKKSGAAKANPASWTQAERNIAFGVTSTDEELGI